MRLRERLTALRPYRKKAEFIFLLLFFLYVCLGFNNLTVGTRIISVFMWPTYLLGAALLLLRLADARQYLKTPGLFSLLGLCCVGAVSILLNLRYDPKGNLIHLIFWAFYFLLCYPGAADADPARDKRRFAFFFHLFCAVALLLTAISFGMLAADYARILTVNGELVRRGFLGGRLFGAYQTPNAGAIVAAVVIVGSVHFIRVYKKKLYTAFAVLNILLQFAYIVFSDSRTGRVCLGLSLGVYLFFAAVKPEKETRRGRRAAACLLLALAVTAVGYFLPKWTQLAYNAAAVRLQTEMPSQTQDPAKPDGAETGPAAEDTLLLGRKESLEGNFTNRRLDFWKSGAEIFLRKPLFGVTFKGFLPFAKEALPDTYLVTNDYMQINTLDNDVMNLLVSNGLAGILCLAVFVFAVLRRLLPFLFRAKRYDPAVPLLLAVCAAAAASSLFSSGVLYMQCQYSVLFWLGLGTLTRLCADRTEAT